MLVEITAVQIEEDGILIKALDLEKSCSWDNLYEDVEPDPVEFFFSKNDTFALPTLDSITSKIYQTKNVKGGIAARVQKLVGVRTVLIPERYLEWGGRTTP